MNQVNNSISKEDKMKSEQRADASYAAAEKARQQTAEMLARMKQSEENAKKHADRAANGKGGRFTPEETGQGVKRGRFTPEEW